MKQIDYDTFFKGKRISSALASSVGKTVFAKATDNTSNAIPKSVMRQYLESQAIIQPMIFP